MKEVEEGFLKLKIVLATQMPVGRRISSMKKDAVLPATTEKQKVIEPPRTRENFSAIGPSEDFNSSLCKLFQRLGRYVGLSEIQQF